MHLCYQIIGLQMCNFCIYSSRACKFFITTEFNTWTYAKEACRFLGKILMLYFVSDQQCVLFLSYWIVSHRWWTAEPHRALKTFIIYFHAKLVGLFVVIVLFLCFLDEIDLNQQDKICHSVNSGHFFLQLQSSCVRIGQAEKKSSSGISWFLV